MTLENMQENRLKAYREELLLSKAELARAAGISHLTIRRIEEGYSCRLETQRKFTLVFHSNVKLVFKGQGRFCIRVYIDDFH